MPGVEFSVPEIVVAPGIDVVAGAPDSRGRSGALLDGGADVREGRAGWVGDR